MKQIPLMIGILCALASSALAQDQPLSKTHPKILLPALTLHRIYHVANNRFSRAPAYWTLAAYREVVVTIKHNDLPAYHKIRIDPHKSLYLSSGTQIEWLGSFRDGVDKVRVRSGPYKGKTVYIQAIQIQ